MAALAVLTAAAAVVSWDAQYTLVLAIKSVPELGVLEAGIPDAGGGDLPQFSKRVAVSRAILAIAGQQDARGRGFEFGLALASARRLLGHSPGSLRCPDWGWSRTYGGQVVGGVAALFHHQECCVVGGRAASGSGQGVRQCPDRLLHAVAGARCVLHEADEALPPELLLAGSVCVPG
jgi:hypothetical protein